MPAAIVSRVLNVGKTQFLNKIDTSNGLDVEVIISKYTILYNFFKTKSRNLECVFSIAVKKTFEMPASHTGVPGITFCLSTQVANAHTASQLMVAQVAKPLPPMWKI